MTAAALAGYLAARHEPLIHAMTLMVAVLGKTESTLGMFASPQTVAAAKAASHAKGILDGNDMNRMFAWLRPNDLVWNYWANNYLLGNSPPIFDILYWSNDSTRRGVPWRNAGHDGRRSVSQTRGVEGPWKAYRSFKSDDRQILRFRPDRPHYAVEGRLCCGARLRRNERI